MPDTKLIALTHPDKKGVTVHQPASTAKVLESVGWTVDKKADPKVATSATAPVTASAKKES